MCRELTRDTLPSILSQADLSTSLTMSMWVTNPFEITRVTLTGGQGYRVEIGACTEFVVERRPHE
jgi:hypothetical protein